MTPKQLNRELEKHSSEFLAFLVKLLKESDLVDIETKVVTETKVIPELSPFLKLIDPETGEEVNYDTAKVEELLLKLEANASDVENIKAINKTLEESNTELSKQTGKLTEFKDSLLNATTPEDVEKLLSKAKKDIK